MNRKRATALTVLLSFAALMITLAVCFNRSTELTILMYHHIADEGDSNVTVSVSRFEEHLAYLRREGYETVSFTELVDYVEGGGELPDKCVAIVFDDGYESNYELAFPLLKAYNAKATISLIGDFVGDDTYKDTGVPVLPYLDWSQAREMLASGLVEFASHTYDMHMSPDYGTEPVRVSAIPLKGESDSSFEAALTADHTSFSELYERELGFKPTVFTYPNGAYREVSENLIRSLGYKVTLTTENGTNCIRKGFPKSLFLLRRYNINDATTLEMLESYLAGRRW